MNHNRIRYLHLKMKPDQSENKRSCFKLPAAYFEKRPNDLDISRLVELMPAMTKGLLDKAYAKNILYTQNSGFKMTTKLKPDFELVIRTTMGTPKLLYRTIFGKPLAKALGIGLVKKTGIKHFRWIPFSQVDKLTLEQRQARQ